MDNDFQLLREFDFNDANAYLWTFKSSQSAAKFRSLYVQTDENLNTHFKTIVRDDLQRLTEHSTYSHISQTNENSCLSIGQTETDFSFLKNQIDQVENEHRVESADQLKGTKGYVVKFISNDSVVYAVKRSTNMWKTNYPKKFLNVMFSNGELTGTEDKSFSIEKGFDFYIINDAIFIANKRGFESILGHKRAYQTAFSSLQTTPEFNNLFSDMSAIITYVGNNSIQLRRMAVIEEKALFTNPSFITNLKRVNDTKSWGINFETTSNKIIPCSSTVKIILSTLLDHRLTSPVTENDYDVPDATQVQ